MAIDIIARGMIESSKSDISQLFDITKGGEIVNNESSYTLNNAVDYPLLGLNLYGKSTQDGTPTPENPVDIVSVGDSGSVAVQACGKNLFDYTLIADKTSNGITYKNNNDGSFTVSGNKTNSAAQSGAAYKYSHKESLQIISSPGTYTISGVPKDYGHGLYFYVNFYYGKITKYSFLSTSGNRTNTVTEDMFTEDFHIDIGFYSAPNYECNNGTFYPQLEKGLTTTDFEPYKGNTASITSALPLCGIPVSEGGNYTDGNGQKWVCDELIYNADGTGKVVKYTGKITYDGSDDEVWSVGSTKISELKRFAVSCSDIMPTTSDNVISDILCNKYNKTSSVDSYNNVEGIAVGKLHGNKVIYIYDGDANNDLATFKSMLAANPVTVVYQLAEPQEIELTAAEMAQLRELQTFDGITNITNGSGADMDVSYCTNKMLSKYVMPITTGLQKQIDELKAAVLSLGGNV